MKPVGHNSYERKRGGLTFTRLVCRASIGGINPKVRDLGRSDAGGIVRVGIHQIAKYGIIEVSFRGRVSAPTHVGVSHTH